MPTRREFLRQSVAGTAAVATFGGDALPAASGLRPGNQTTFSLHGAKNWVVAWDELDSAGNVIGHHVERHTQSGAIVKASRLLDRGPTGDNWM